MLKNRYKQAPNNSKLLCKYDLLNKVNFHKYIDDIPYLLVLIELQNGNIIGGFSFSPFNKNIKG